MRQLYYNGNIITMNEAQPKAEAVLLEDGIIIAVGSTADLTAQKGDAQMVDLDGATVLPGFIDTHSHFASSYVFPRFDPSPVGKTDSVKDLVEQAKEYLAANPVKDTGRVLRIRIWYVLGRRSLPYQRRFGSDFYRNSHCNAQYQRLDGRCKQQAIG